MTVEEVYEIMENDCEFIYDDLADDEILEGLKILEKYIDKRVVQGAKHDIIFSEDISVLIQKGLSKEDVIQLSRLGWHIDEGDCFAHFVKRGNIMNDSYIFICDKFYAIRIGGDSLNDAIEGAKDGDVGYSGLEDCEPHTIPSKETVMTEQDFIVNYVDTGIFYRTKNGYYKYSGEEEIGRY